MAGSLRLSDSSFSLTNRLSEASDTTFTVVNGIADPPNVASVISTNELSRSQITAVPVQADKVSTDPSNMHNNLKKVQASTTAAAAATTAATASSSSSTSSNATSNVTSPTNDLNHNGLTKQEGSMENAAMVKLEEQ